MDYINEMDNLVQNLTVVENNEEFIPIYETDKGANVGKYFFQVKLDHVIFALRNIS